MKKHTFSICAYKESPYLEQCIKSLIVQQKYSEIIICTSTGNGYIKNLAEKYKIPLYVRDGKSDIVDDWNYAVKMAKTPWVTVAHQDDIYNENYSEELVTAIAKCPDAGFAFTNYRPLKSDKITSDLNCRVKEVCRFVMKNHTLARKKFWKKFSLAFGNSICCPSCAYNKALLGDRVFRSKLKFACDWDTFVDLAESPYPFLYVDKILIYYRIHEEATSMAWTENGDRKKEEFYMFRRFWPEWLIKLGYPLFKFSYKTYITSPKKN